MFSHFSRTALLQQYSVIKEKKRDGRGREVTSAKTVLDILKGKHPVASSACKNSLLSDPKQRVEDLIYESIDGELIQIRCQEN